MPKPLWPVDLESRSRRYVLQHFKGANNVLHDIIRDREHKTDEGVINKVEKLDRM